MCDVCQCNSVRFNESMELIKGVQRVPTKGRGQWYNGRVKEDIVKNPTVWFFCST